MANSSRPASHLDYRRTGTNPRGAMGTVVLEAGPSIGDLVAKLDLALIGKASGRHHVAIACSRDGRSRLTRQLPDRFAALDIVKSETWWRELQIDTPRIAYLPAGGAYGGAYWEDFPEDGMVLRPWVPKGLIPEIGQVHQVRPVAGWIATTALLGEISREPPGAANFFAITELLARRRLEVRCLSSTAMIRDRNYLAPECPSPKINASCSVLAIVPHYNCAQWLEQCLRSLARQTRPPEAIVVVDDASPTAPADIVARFANVTLLRTQENVGPYRIVQSVIEQFSYDAYLFQDADDWSTDDRLQLLLEEAERSGAELIGCQELAVNYGKGRATAVLYPLDANRSLPQNPVYSLLHPSSLVSRDLVLRLGGFASGLRFGGDYEFQLRAHHAARIVNIDRFCYFRRIHPRSLTNSADTGLASDARQTQDSQVRLRALENAKLSAAGAKPNLAPLLSGEPVELRHIGGPPLAGRAPGPFRRRI